MSEQSVEAVRRLFEVFEQRDARGAFDLLDPEVEWDTTRYPFPDLSGVYRGREAVLEWWARWLAPWETMEFEIEQLIEAGDDVVVVTRGTGRGREGIEADVSFTCIYTVRGRKVARMRMYMERDAALEAAGLSA